MVNNLPLRVGVVFRLPLEVGTMNALHHVYYISYEFLKAWDSFTVIPLLSRL